MIFIILSWIYISIIFFSFGIVCTVIVDRLAGRDKTVSDNFVVPHVSMLFIGGIVFTAIIASALSLFMPLSLIANFIMFSTAIVLMFVFRQKVFACLTEYRNGIKDTHWSFVLLFGAFVLLAAYLSSLPSSHNDDGLYYATTIKWIEEYGSVKGLANVNPRIGFNSNWHVLQALFSFHYFHAANFNDLNGLLLIILFPYCLRGFGRLLKNDHRIATIASVLFFLPLIAFHFGSSSDFIFFNVNFLSAPAADLAVCSLIWITLIRFIELDNEDVPDRGRRMVFIILVSTFLFTVKSSAAPLLMTCIFFFAVYLYKKQFSRFVYVALLCFAVAAPWITRNIIISGYPIFPLSLTDVLQVDWKLPVQHVKWFENAVKVYAIDPTYDLNKPFTLTFSEWFPAWFGRLKYIQSVIVAFSAVSIVVFVLIFLFRLLRDAKSFLVGNGHLILSIIIAVAGSFFWLLKGPDPRLGYGFTGMLSMLMISVMLNYFLGPYVKYAAYVLVIIFYSILLFHYNDKWKDVFRYLVRPLPERRMPKSFTEVTLNNGLKIHLTEDADCWYMPLPVTTKNEFYTIQPVQRGKSIQDGFKTIQKNN
ncbi:MAG TPA: hypothetical protein VGD17_19055 [Chitinophagaceae bacterium]